jgi:subtilase-type proteinase RRT12
LLDNGTRASLSLHERISLQESGDSGIVDSPVHVHDAHLVQRLVAGKALVRGGEIGFEEDASIETVPSLEWHQLRVASRTLPMKQTFIAKNLGKDVNVYLVDSGIKADHPEFEFSNIVNLYSHNDSFDDDTGHGTGVASVIIGKTLGISTEATLKNVKIPMGQSIPLSSLLEAFNAIAADKIEADEIAVINCSWTIPKSMILDNLVADLRSQGFLVVAAAGNTISNADDLSPVGYDAVLGVGASDAFDRVISWATNVGSNWGKEVDLFAPGIDVMIANKNGGITEASGTSISAGIVSSIAAQYIHDFKNN